MDGIDFQPDNSGSEEIDFQPIDFQPDQSSEPSMPFTQTGKMRLSDLVTPRLGSRLLGTPEGQTAGQQFKQMYDRSGDAGNMPYAARFANSAATGIAGDVVDQAINPATYLAVPAIKYGVAPVLKGAFKGASGLAKFFTGKTTEETIRALRNSKSAMMANDIPQSASGALAGVRNAVEEWIPKVSKAYGDKYRPLVDQARVGADDLLATMNKAAADSDLIGLTPEQLKALGPEAESFMNWLNTLKSKATDQVIKSPILDASGKAIESVSKGVSDFGVGEVDDFLKNLLSSNYGKQYGGGQRILTNARVALSDVLKNVPGVQALKDEFAPILQAKSAAWRALKPFSKSADYEMTGKALLERVAKGKTAGIKPEQDLINFLKQQSPELEKLLSGVENVGAAYQGTTKKIADLLTKKTAQDAMNKKLIVGGTIAGATGIPAVKKLLDYIRHVG